MTIKPSPYKATYYKCTVCGEGTRARDCICDACHRAGHRADAERILDEHFQRMSSASDKWQMPYKNWIKSFSKTLLPPKKWLPPVKILHLRLKNF